MFIKNKKKKYKVERKRPNGDGEKKKKRTVGEAGETAPLPRVAHLNERKERTSHSSLWLKKRKKKKK